MLLLELPAETTVNNIRWTAEEGLCILLRRLAYPCRLVDLVPTFGRWKTELSTIVNVVCIFIFQRWSFLMHNFAEAPWFTPQRLQAYAEATSKAECPLLNCWGFVDGTVRAMCRPIVGQKAFYNGHKRYHGLVYQIVSCPDGLIAHIFGPMEGCRHNSGVLRESGLLDELDTLPLAPDGNPYCIYGDPAYPLRPTLMAPYKGNNLPEGHQLFNKAMSALRVSVEWTYGKILQQFAYVDFKKGQKVNLQPIACYYIVAALFTNCHTCLYGSETTSTFNCRPPTLEEYLTR